MHIETAHEPLHVTNSDLADSRFSNVRLANAAFEDVAMPGAAFTNANLHGARFSNVDLSAVTVEDANLAGATIDGIPVASLLQAYRSRATAVIFAKNLPLVQDFYRALFSLAVASTAADHVVLDSPARQLTIHRIPEPIASTIEISEPPVRRTAVPIKLTFDVESLAAARERAPLLGGNVDAVEREWARADERLCDGCDPEGNVLQFRQRMAPAAAAPGSALRGHAE